MARKRRKIGRYLLLALIVFVLYGQLKKRHSRRLPELPGRVEKAYVVKLLKPYPALKRRLVSIHDDRIYLTYGRVIICGGGNLNLKLSAADSIISANYGFRVMDFRHDGWAILRR